MYIFEYGQFRAIVALLSALLISTTLIQQIPDFQTFVLIGAGSALLLMATAASLLPKKLVVFGTFCIAICLSFVHFLFNVTFNTTLVAAIYSTSFLTLFTLLVTNFREKTLLEA